MSAFAFLLASLAITSGTYRSLSGKPKSTSGITWAGGNKYYVVSDDGIDTSSEGGLYPLTVTLASDGKSIASHSYGSCVKLADCQDLEAVAYDPATGWVWVANEYHSDSRLENTIRAYDPESGVLMKTLDIPKNAFTACRQNFGLESLTLSGDGLTLWTCNEEANQRDGSRSSYSTGTTVRLTKFKRATVRDDFAFVGQWPYTTGKWTLPSDYGSKARRGVADLVALPDGTLLALERELSFSSASIFASTHLGYYIYQIDFTDATEISAKYSLVTDTNWTAVKKTLLTSCIGDMFDSAGYGNYEGICLGPRITGGGLELLLITDFGDGYSDGYLKPLILGGLDAHTLFFTPGDAGSADPIGGPYRYKTGTCVTTSVSGLSLEPPAYTNRYEPRHGDTCIWSLPKHSPAKGTGSNVTFTVSAEDTFTWLIDTNGVTDATSDLVLSDGFEDGTVANYSLAPPGYPLPRERHERVLTFGTGLTDVTRRTINDSGTADRIVEAVLRLDRWNSFDGYDFLDEELTKAQTAVAADRNGCLCLYDPSTKDWLPLATTVFADGEWVRITLRFSSLGVQVRLNGELCRRAPGAAGVWWPCGTVRPTAIAFAGQGAVDDLLVAYSTWKTARSGSSTLDGVPYEWFELKGVENAPSAPAPGGSGYTLRETYVAGLEPYSSDLFELIGFSVGGDGSTTLRFRGARPDPEQAYVIEAAATPDGFTGVDIASAGTFVTEGDTTSWSATLSDTGEAVFYRVRAVLHK